MPSCFLLSRHHPPCSILHSQTRLVWHPFDCIHKDYVHHEDFILFFLLQTYCLISKISAFRCHVNTCPWMQWRSGLFVSVVETICVYIGACLLSGVLPVCALSVGFILCHAALNSDAAALSLWKLALQSSTCLCLFRDEVFHIHKAAEDLFVNIRG